MKWDIRNINLTETISYKSFFQDSNVTGMINGTPIFNSIVRDIKQTHGFLAIGTDNFGIAHFDNFQIKTV